MGKKKRSNYYDSRSNENDNHVPSSSDGEVKKILVQDGQPRIWSTLVILN